ncbi:hypothetical protein [Paenibacillus koleovorans]|uniref:hypothetical protein n=1 Tax=Paenibacillus koleovorans TaxID=121608 RepID=UPI000FDC60D8|nr:hypothetical protein [Paenibacillus koleovorans]
MECRMYTNGLKEDRGGDTADPRRQWLQVEFSYFLRSYLQSKAFMQDAYLLDAYQQVLEALQHWARIVIIEEGLEPEQMVWAQVRRVNPGVHKLYEEITSNEESLEQRVKLVLLACEFAIMSKMESCCSVLLDVIRSRPEPWSLQDLSEKPELRDLKLDLPVLMAKMSRKELVREVAVSADDSLLLELKYTVC